MNGEQLPLITLAQPNFPGFKFTVEVIDNEVYIVGPADKTKLIKSSCKKGRRGCFYVTCESLLNIPMPPQ